MTGNDLKIFKYYTAIVKICLLNLLRVFILLGYSTGKHFLNNMLVIVSYYIPTLHT